MNAFLHTLTTSAHRCIASLSDFKLVDSVIELDELDELNNLHIKGFAVKLSILKRLNLSLKEILDTVTCKILIDAEYSRLDTWVKLLLENDLVNFEQLDRVIFTVQAKRTDAYEQLLFFTKNSLNVTLVLGNNTYLSKAEQQRDGLSVFSNLLTKFDVTYLGISTNFKQKLEKRLHTQIDNSKIIELQGYQKLKGSVIWSYYSRLNLSASARKYLMRRSKFGKSELEVGRFICRSIAEIVNLSSDHWLWLFVDEQSKESYMVMLLLFDKMRNVKYW